MASPGPLEATTCVVVHVDEAGVDRQRLALGNVGNLLADVGEGNVAVEVVFNGPAISALRAGSPLAPELAAVHARGVGLLACQNSMVATGLHPEDLLAGVTVIASGISHLVRRQGEGWAYVRP